MNIPSWQKKQSISSSFSQTDNWCHKIQRQLILATHPTLKVFFFWFYSPLNPNAIHVYMWSVLINSLIPHTPYTISFQRGIPWDSSKDAYWKFWINNLISYDKEMPCMMHVPWKRVETWRDAWWWLVSLYTLSLWV